MTAIFTDRLGLDWDGDDDEEVQVAAAVDLTLNNVVSYLVACMYFEDFDRGAMDALDDAAYDQLLDMVERDPEMLAKAVIALLIPHASALADRLVHQFRDLPERPVNNAVNNALACPDTGCEQPDDQPRRDTT